MSARDVIESIKALPEQDLQEVREFLASMDGEANQSGSKTMPRDVFDRAKEQIFANYGPLLEQLAK